MNLTTTIAGGALVVMIVLAARLFRRPHRDLEAYMRAAEREAATRIKRMRDDTSRFDAHEAMAPVEAGVRELLELHGLPPNLHITREGDALHITSPAFHCRVIWVLRHTTLIGNYPGRPRSFTPRTIHGNGHWELILNNGLPEPCADLASLMGRLSAILRDMVRQGHEV